MAKVVMMYENYSVKVLAMVALGAVGIMCMAVVVGVVGPATNLYHDLYAYSCPDSSHSWSPSCSGVQLSQPNSEFTFQLPPLTPLNRFWSLVLFPFPSSSVPQTGVEASLIVEATVYYYSDDEGEWLVDGQGSVGSSQLLLCQPEQSPCWGFVLAFEDHIKHTHYAVSVTFPDEGDNLQTKQYIGDVGFQVQWVNGYFAMEEVCVRGVYLLISSACLLALLYRLLPLSFSLLSFEQQSLPFLLLGLIFLNNPFYAFEYLLPGPFFPVLDCILVTLHLLLLISFWLFSLDLFRRGEEKMKGRVEDIPKIVLVVIFGIFNVVIYVWFRLMDQADPVMGEVHHSSGLVALFFITIFIFAGLIIWTIILAVLAYTEVMKRGGRERKVRFGVLALPAAFLILSLLLGLFFGTFGPIHRHAPAFVYFFTLYNLYVWLLLAAYFPSPPSPSLSLSESSPINPSPSDFGPSSDTLFGENDTL